MAVRIVALRAELRRFKVYFILLYVCCLFPLIYLKNMLPNHYFYYYRYTYNEFQHVTPERILVRLGRRQTMRTMTLHSAALKRRY